MTQEFHEDQYTISRWANEAFGVPTSLVRVAARANEEMAELLRALSAGDDAGALEEIADVFIVLYRLASFIAPSGPSLQTVINRKMAKNRAREWKRDGTGHGYHVKKNEAIEALRLQWNTNGHSQEMLEGAEFDFSYEGLYNAIADVLGEPSAAERWAEIESEAKP